MVFISMGTVQYNYKRFSFSTAPPSLSNSVYALFKEIWEPLSIKLDFTLNYDDFLRFDICHAVFQGDRPCALLFSSVFDFRLEATTDHSYVNKFPKGFMKNLKEDNVQKIITFEYLTTAKVKNRKKLGNLVLGAAFRSIADLEIDIGVCLTRDDVGVDKMVHEFGFNKFPYPGEINGLPTSYHTMESYKQSKNFEINVTTSLLWESKLDLIEEKFYDRSGKQPEHIKVAV